MTTIVPQRLHRTMNPAATTHYLLALPDADANEPDVAWPLLLFLHGSGERGDDLALVKLHGPLKEFERDLEVAAIVVAPQCPAEQDWDLDILDALLVDVTTHYRVDVDRVMVTGLSRGGRATWRLASAYTERFSAIAPVCGRPDLATVERLRHLPVWAFHGAKDPLVPLAPTEEMIARLQDAGGPARLTVYPDAEHDSWTATYANPDLYRWLLAQRRRARGETESRPVPPAAS